MGWQDAPIIDGETGSGGEVTGWRSAPIISDPATQANGLPDGSTVTDTEFEGNANPALDQRDKVERELFAVDCTSLHDMALKLDILAHLDWSDSDLRTSIHADVKRILAAYAATT